MSKRLTYLNNTDYRMWIDDAVAQQKELSSALDGLGNQRIVGHASLQDGVTRTVYEDRQFVYVNYNDSAVTAEGHVVEAKGYTVVPDRAGRRDNPPLRGNPTRERRFL